MIKARCTNIKLVTGMGNLRAYADVTIFDDAGEPDELIRAVRVVQQQGQKAWVQMPAQQGKDGRWYPIVKFFKKEKREAIKAAVLAAYEELA